MFMQLLTASMLHGALLCGRASAAQEQRGSIQGTVRDTTGAVLPGVTVEARSVSGAVVSTVSDGTGTYRFPSLQPGRYDVSATLASFKPDKVPNIDLPVGET